MFQSCLNICRLQRWLQALSVCFSLNICFFLNTDLIPAFLPPPVITFLSTTSDIFCLYSDDPGVSKTERQCQTVHWTTVKRQEISIKSCWFPGVTSCCPPVWLQFLSVCRDLHIWDRSTTDFFPIMRYRGVIMHDPRQRVWKRQESNV